MDGSMTLHFLLQMYSVVSMLMGEFFDGCEVVDIGAGSGIVLAIGLILGAHSGCGVELRDQHMVCNALKSILLQLGVLTEEFNKLLVHYNCNVANCRNIPSVVRHRAPKFALAFCDGFSPKDKAILFKLVREDPKIIVFVCSPGKSAMKYGGKFNNAASILAQLNMKYNVFEHVANQQVSMFGSGSKKTLHFFRRIGV